MKVFLMLRSHSHVAQHKPKILQKKKTSVIKTRPVSLLSYKTSVTNLQFLSGDTSRGRIRNRNGSFAYLHQLAFPEHHHCIIQVVDLLVEVTLTEVGDACHSHWGEPQGMEDTSPHGSHSLLPSHLSLL